VLALSKVAALLVGLEFSSGAILMFFCSNNPFIFRTLLTLLHAEMGGDQRIGPVLYSIFMFVGLCLMLGALLMLRLAF
jgi:hypothetical protein